MATEKDLERWADEKARALSGKSQTTGSVSQKLEILGGRRVTGEQLERLRSAVDAGQTAALEAMERRLSREKPIGGAKRRLSLKVSRGEHKLCNLDGRFHRRLHLLVVQVFRIYQGLVLRAWVCFQSSPWFVCTTYISQMRGQKMKGGILK